MNIIFRFLFCLILDLLLFSCNKSLSEEPGWDALDFYYHGDVGYGEWVHHDFYSENDGKIVSRSFFHITPSSRAKGIIERERMEILEAKMKCYPKKCEKYERMIQEEKSKLQRNREIRINQRIEFLRSFYNDLYEISQKDFTKKYKYHIADNILKTIEDLYFETYGRKGYYWTIFGDNKIHNGQDFSFTQYGKTLKPEETYAYYDNDNPWYKVTMGDNAVDIRVKGENGDVIITGLRNRLLNITILASK